MNVPRIIQRVIANGYAICYTDVNASARLSGKMRSALKRRLPDYHVHIVRRFETTRTKLEIHVRLKSPSYKREYTKQAIQGYILNVRAKRNVKYW